MKKIKFLLLGVVLFSSVSCSDFVEKEGINDSPNAATDAPMSTYLNSSQLYYMALNEGEDARLATMWAQQFTGEDRQYAGYEGYGVTTEVFSFFNYYIGAIQSSLLAEEKAKNTDNRASIGVAKVIRAATFGRLAALFGDIPFAEANQYPKFDNPKYDGQKSVYDGVQAMLDDAIADLESGKGVIAADLFGVGSAANWVAVARSFKARFYLHVGDYPNALAQAKLGVSASVLAPHGTATNGDQNTWFDFQVNDRTGYMGASNSHLAASLDSANAKYRGNSKTDETARFAKIYTGEEGAYGLNTSGSGYFAQDAPTVVISSNEMQLIQAEALLKGSSPDFDGALAALNNVRAALQSQFGGKYEAYVAADFADGGIARGDAVSDNAALLNEIYEEKYATLVGQVEVFNDFRRLKNPFGLTPSKGDKFPQRFLYPSSEVNANKNIPSPLPGLFDVTPVNNN